MVESSWREEQIGGGSLGLIDISEGPIHWINVIKKTVGDSSVKYYTEYGVPDRRLSPSSPRYQIKTVRVKTFPLFGRVSDLHWKGEDFGLGIIDPLDSDISLKHPIMKSRDVIIRAHGDQMCWIISTETRDVPSEELWNCYQSIAKHLLAEWSQS